jgi:hypothetical protein
MIQKGNVKIWAWSLVLIGLSSHASFAGEDPPAAPPASNQRDRFLLDDIVPPNRTAPAPASAADSSRESSSEERAGQPAEAARQRVGSDLGEASGGSAGPDSFFRELTELMQTAQQQLRAGNSREETQQLQQRVVEQLDQLIAAQEDQQQPSSSEQRRTDESESEPSESEASAEAGEDSGEETAGTEGQNGEEAASGRDRPPTPPGRSDDDVWGHLPERMRQQLQNAAGERFLPKYEDLIEAFYRRLAEDDSPLSPRMTP